MTQPRVTDNDAGEISVTIDGQELRGWSYKDDPERRTKMGHAREYVEGWCDAKGYLGVAQGQSERGALADARAYVERAIASYAGDPADNQFQKGFLAALEVVRDEAFSVSSTNSGDAA